MKRAALALLACLSPVAFAAGPLPKASAPPKVVFIGDTTGWTSAFAAHPNWINMSTPAGDYYLDAASGGVLNRFQADVVSLHPAIVHILVGAGDLSMNQSNPVEQVVPLPTFIQNVTGMIQQAKAANIRVILGTTPQLVIGGSPFHPDTDRAFNAWLTGYGSEYGVTVVNYHDVLCNCIGSADPYVVGDGGGGLGDPATPLEYAVMAALAETAIETQTLTLKGGYLQGPTSNQLQTGSVVQFTPLGMYSDGVTRALLNTNYAGASGVWTSSNPAVLYVSQTGSATALQAGKARVSFRSATGVYFNPWDVTVPQFCFSELMGVAC